MKRIILLAIALVFSSYVFSQQEIPSAKVGVEYGDGIKNEKTIDIEKIARGVVSTDSIYTRITGEVTEVCVKKGCFMKVKTRSQAEPIMVRFKDYGFFMPQDVIGKTVVAEGVSVVKETSVAQLKHFAEDAGKSEAEIAKITSPKTDVEIIASGVKIIK